MSEDDKKDNKDKKKKNPWAKDGQSSSKPRIISSSSSASGGENVYDLKKAQEQFKKYIPDTWEGPKLIIPGLIVLILIWLASGIYFIQPSENGVVLTFGKFSKTVENPGLKWHMPWPVQNVEVVNVTNERRIEVGFRTFSNGRADDTARDVADESLMLTGDENIIDIDFVVLWRVGSAANYLFKIRDPDATIKIVAESAMREIIGKTNIQPALTEARNQIQASTRELMQQMLDEYQAGVQINNVQLQKVDPPAPVIDAFNDVQRARQQKEELRNKAEAYSNDIIPRARGESEKMRQQSQAYREQIVNRAKGDAQRFDSIYAGYSTGKKVTTDRLYLETMEEVLGNANTIILDGSGKGGAVPYLSINELKNKVATQ